MVNPIVREYFEHGDTKEVQVSDPYTSLMHSDYQVILVNQIMKSRYAMILRTVIVTLFLPSFLTDVAEGAKPGPTEVRVLVPGRVPVPGRQGQPQRADLPPAVRSDRQGAVTERHGSCLRQDAQRAARPHTGHAGGSKGKAHSGGQKLRRSGFVTLYSCKTVKPCGNYCIF